MEGRAAVRERGEGEAADRRVQRAADVCLRGALGARQARHPRNHHQEGKSGELEDMVLFRRSQKVSEICRRYVKNM